MSEPPPPEPAAAALVTGPAPDSAPGVEAAGRHHVQRRTLRVLAAAQVLGGIGMGSGIAVGGLLAERVSGTEAAAGLAQTATVLGSAVLAVPAAALAARAGRRPGLTLAYVIAVLGGLLVIGGAAMASLPAVLAGMFLFGAGTTAGLQARYAATDLAETRHRGSALSFVVWSSTLGAVAGPNLGDPSAGAARALNLPELAGPFLIATVALAAAGLVIVLALRPDPLRLVRSAATAVPGAVVTIGLRAALRTVWATPAGRLGLTSVVVGHSVMVAVMVLTPVHLDHGGHGLRVIGVVISLHIAGMYALSPVVGRLTDRWGRAPVVRLGAGLLAAALLVAGTAPGPAALQLGVGLTLLGLGWSCCLIAGSTLVTDAVAEPLRPRVQGTADLVMGLAAATAGLLAGPVVVAVGYGGLTVAAGLVLLPLVLAAARPGLSRGPGTA